MPSPVRALSLGLVAALAAVAGLVVASIVFKPGASGGGVVIESGTLLPTPRTLPEFTLTAGDGQAFTKAALTGQWSMLFVGFTHCPDICPSTLGLLKSVYRQLDAQQKTLNVVLLSVDPERDTPALLAQYAGSFDPSFKGVTGPFETLNVLGSALGFVYLKRIAPPPADYTIDHSSALILVNPQAQVAGYFTPPLKIEALVADLAKIIPSRS